MNTSRKILVMATLAAFSGLPTATAGPPAVPPGKASATPTYDYRDFTAPGVSQRVFEGSQYGDQFTVVEDVTYTPESGEVLSDRKWVVGGAVQQRHILRFLQTDTDYFWHWDETYDAEGNLLRTDTFDPPLSIRQSAMPKGALQGYGAIRLMSPDGIEFGTTRTNVALGLDNVEVPYGAFSDCLRMFEEHNGVSRISWYCPDVGLTKRFWGNTGLLWQLSGCVGCPSM